MTLKSDTKYGQYASLSFLLIYISVLQEVFNWDCFAEVDFVEGLAAAATKHLELLKQKDEAESSFIIEKIVGKTGKKFFLPMQNFKTLG